MKPELRVRRECVSALEYPIFVPSLRGIKPELNGHYPGKTSKFERICVNVRFRTGLNVISDVCDRITCVLTSVLLRSSITDQLACKLVNYLVNL